MNISNATLTMNPAVTAIYNMSLCLWYARRPRPAFGVAAFGCVKASVCCCDALSYKVTSLLAYWRECACELWLRLHCMTEMEPKQFICA